MRWVYEASLDWLEARKEVLTATDVVSLLPELKRIRKNGMEIVEVGDKQLAYSLSCAKLWAEKQDKGELDAYAPSDAAARGHVLEPFAIREFNHLAQATIYPWDDMVVVREDGLGFSPDGLDMEMPYTPGVCVLPATAVDDPTRVIEVKSYNAGKHIEMMLEDPAEHKERYQLAVAMAVLPNLKMGALVFYNPNSPRPVVVHTYKRENLEQEIEDVEDIAKMYNETKETLENEGVGSWFHAQFSEEQIYEIHQHQLADAMGIGRNVNDYIEQQQQQSQQATEQQSQ